MGIQVRSRVCALAVAGCLLLPAAAGQAPGPGERVGLPQDWSHQRVVYGNAAGQKLPAAAAAEPRFLHQKLLRERARGPKAKTHGRKRRVDWSVTLGGTGSRLAPGTFPAKYTFNINATPSCTDDFVVFGLNVAGSPGQATIVAYNNLYVGPGSTELCPGLDQPTVKWAYNTGEAINTSPVLSLDGKKVAWVANRTSPTVQPVLHVLTIGTSGDNGTVPVPATPGTNNNAVVIDVPFGTDGIGNTRSSLFLDYRNDVAYVGDDNGRIHKFTGVFFGTPTEATGAWLNGIETADGPGRVLTSVVYDSVSGNLFYGTDRGTFGYLREVGSTLGVCLNAGSGEVPPCLGLNSYVLCADNGDWESDSTCAVPGNPHPIVDAPLLDQVTQNLFVFIGNDDGGNARVLQTDTQLSSGAAQATLGQSGADLFAGTFDSNYYTSAGSGFLYACGYTAALTANPVLYRIGFDSAGVMDTATDGNSLALSNSAGGTQCSPLSEIFNPPQLKDWLFLSVKDGCTVGGAGTGGCIMSFDITSGFPGGITQGRAAQNGTSGIVVDNVVNTGAFPQASSIYFTNQGDATCGDGIGTGGCAVKLTQLDLN